METYELTKKELKKILQFCREERTKDLEEYIHKLKETCVNERFK